jgi:hypothetical protein
MGESGPSRVIINLPPGFKGCKGVPPGSCPVCIPISKKSEYCYFCEISLRLTKEATLNA